MSKYTDMMDEAAFECLDEAHINEREGNDKVAELERSKSADWRAMREAWEARDKLLTVYYVSHNDKFGPCECGACAEYRKARVT